MIHRDRLNQVAVKHGLPLLTGWLAPGDYCGYALDLICIELGLIKPDDDFRAERADTWLARKREITNSMP